MTFISRRIASAPLGPLNSSWSLLFMLGVTVVVLASLGLVHPRSMYDPIKPATADFPRTSMIDELPATRGDASAAAAAGPRRLNLLIIVADDHGEQSMGIAGDPRRATPNLDTLARQGLFFDHAYCNAPLCTPSRQSLITGKLPHAIKVTQLGTRLSDKVLTMGEWFSKEGYETIAIGKMHFNGPSNHGFARRIDRDDWQKYLESHPPSFSQRARRWRPLVDPARVWLNASARSAGLPAESMEATYFVDQATHFFDRQGDRPFAMVIGFYEPHSPFPFPREWKGRYSPAEFDVPPLSRVDQRDQPAVFASLSADEIRGIQAAYFTSLSFMDHQVGRLIHALDAAGLARDTLVVYVGDNGYMLGEHGRFEKHCFYEPSVRIPLILRWPGHLPADVRIHGLVEMVDILPTVCHLLGVVAPPAMQGIDLVPLIEGQPGAGAHQVVFSEYLENQEAMVRSERYKLIVGSGRRLRQDGYQSRKPLPLPGPYERLFDVVHDPGETNDLGNDPTFAAEKAALLDQMYKRLMATRQGLEPVPDGLSPRAAIDWCLVPRDR